MDYENVLGESKFPTYEQLKSGLIRLIEEGKITREDAGMILPELRESEDEQTRKQLIDFISNIKEIAESGRSSLAVRKDDAEMCDAFLLYLDKQKEQPKEELVYRLNGLMQEYIKEGKDDMEKEHRFKCYQLFWDSLEDTSYFEQKEQKSRDYCSVRDEFDLDGNLKQKDHFRDDTKWWKSKTTPVSMT